MKQHVPKDGYTGATQGEALCGRWVHWDTGDHNLIRRQAIGYGCRSHWCGHCLAALRRQTVAYRPEMMEDVCL